MERTAVASSNVVSVGFEDGVLEVEFRGGSVYRYQGVPGELYQELLLAESAGRFLAQRIKNVFECEKIE